jgi:type IV pilus assembly protein PilY1
MGARVVPPVAWAATALLWAGQAAAQGQADTNPPVPNVLLLLDNSGSMERMIDGSLPESTPANACNCTDNGPLHAPTCVFPDSSNPSVSSPIPNRWNTVQQAMTGYLQAQAGANSGFNCVSMPRASGGTFTTEYQINKVPPYDQGYYLNYHRMVAEDTTLGTGASAVACVIGPGPLPGAVAGTGVGPSPTLAAGGNATDYVNVPSATVARPYGASFGTTPTCNFAQLKNGAVTTMSALMRFGLMTFDSDPDPSTGVTNTNSIAASPFTGMWSYFPNWAPPSPQACNFNPWAPAVNCEGAPANCSTLSPMAVGSRNGGAPPWEGRMVPLPTPSGLTQAQSNAEVAQVILASRPYGATPIAGMLTAAEYYFQGDPTGPQSDPFVTPGAGGGSPCRREYIILITDGAPNLDLRTSCDATTGTDGGTTGTCPFNLPATTAGTLYQGGMPSSTQQFVTTYVIGFATSSFTSDGGTLVQCSSLTPAQIATDCMPAGGPSAPPGSPPSDPTFLPCCQLENIAAAGGSTHAYFADTAQDLQKALGSILGSIGVNATARTVPTFSPVLTAGNAQMYNAWLYPNPGAPWAGDIKRTTYACPATGGAPPTVNLPSVSNGDDFAANLNLGASMTSRTFISMEPKNAANTVHDATASIRPYAPSTASTYDGMLLETATTLADSTANSSLTPFTSGLTDDAMNITPGSNSYQYTPVTGVGTKFLSDTQTESMILSFIFGQAEPGTIPTDFVWQPRCVGCSSNAAALVPPSAFGDIYHATPAVVGAPDALLDDATYSGFRTYIATNAGGGDAGASTPRRPVVYAATNDGLLHAFYADVFSNTQNEAWAMLMPAALPQLLSSYPATDKMLLDGSPIVKDVVWDRTTINSSLCGSGTSVSVTVPPTGTASCPWHTTLVAGYGPSQQGYYAVDVTNPASPLFRWQLTKIPSATPNFNVFGANSATPAITTITLNDSSGKPHEVGVAVLPGGSNGLPTGGACERIHAVTGTGTDSEDSGYLARSYVNCWGSPAVYGSAVSGRSLSIVRLDTGEIVRVFARAADFNAADALVTSSAITDTQLDSPMTGTPVIYPPDVGATATKIFVGDEDGTVWRFDVSNPDPTKWFGDMFLDLYNPIVDPPHAPTAANPPGNYADGQPFSVPMVTSLDTSGNLVLNIASGTTQTFDTNGIEYLYSVSEKVGGTPTKLRASVNWYWIPKSGSTTTPSYLQTGERVSGPMTVFNGTLYFTTYYAGNPANGCNTGRAKLWGFDYVTPQSTSALWEGGLRSAATTCSPTQDWLDPGEPCGTAQAAIVPGVAVLATPACAQATTALVGGVSHTTLSNVAAGSFSLVANISANGTNPGTQLQMNLPTPVGPTFIDSWASVIE